MMDGSEIIAHLPYDHPFLFVDSISRVDEHHIEGEYTFKPDAWFYRGHFKDHPVTPGVILTECMAQIGLVCLGIYLLGKENPAIAASVALSHTEVDFLKPVSPGETVCVRSKKEYFRFHKLKCQVKMFDKNDELLCSGILSGMLIPGAK